MIWKKQGISKDIILGAFIDNKLADWQRNQFEAELERDAELLELMTAVEDVISPPVASSFGNAPMQLISKTIGLYKANPGFAHLTLGLLEKAIRVITCSDNLSLHFPVAEPVRGVASNPSTILTARVFENMQVEVEAERVAVDKGCSVRMSIVPALCDSGNKIRVTLNHLERELYSGPLENGQILFEDMMPGLYSLIIKNSGKIVGEISLKLVDQSTGGACGY